MEKFKEDPRVQEILEQVKKTFCFPLSNCSFLQGLDVREYSQNVEKLLETAEKKSVNDYVSQQQSLVDLHQEIKVIISFTLHMYILLTYIYFTLN